MIYFHSFFLHSQREGRNLPCIPENRLSGQASEEIKFSYGKIAGTTTCIHNHEVLRWTQAMNLREESTMNGCRFGLCDNVKTISPIFTCLCTLDKISCDCGIPHYVAAFCVPCGWNGQPDLRGIWRTP